MWDIMHVLILYVCLEFVTINEVSNARASVTATSDFPIPVGAESMIFL